MSIEESRSRHKRITAWRYPQRRVTVIVLTNRNDSEPYRLALAIAEL